MELDITVMDEAGDETETGFVVYRDVRHGKHGFRVLRFINGLWDEISMISIKR